MREKTSYLTSKETQGIGSNRTSQEADGEKKCFSVNIFGRRRKHNLKYSLYQDDYGYCCFHLEISVLLPLREV